MNTSVNTKLTSMNTSVNTKLTSMNTSLNTKPTSMNTYICDKGGNCSWLLYSQTRLELNKTIIITKLIHNNRGS
jgi:hypothetical protein